MKVHVCVNNLRGNANVATQVVEASSTMDGLLQVLGQLDEKTFKRHGYITAHAWCVESHVRLTAREEARTAS